MHYPRFCMDRPASIKMGGSLKRHTISTGIFCSSCHLNSSLLHLTIYLSASCHLNITHDDPLDVVTTISAFYILTINEDSSSRGLRNCLARHIDYQRIQRGSTKEVSKDIIDHAMAMDTVEEQNSTEIIVGMYTL